MAHGPASGNSSPHGPGVSERMKEAMKMLRDSIIHPPHHGMSPGQYLRSRFKSLKPQRNKVPNPIPLLKLLNARQWQFFLVAFAAWVRERKEPDERGEERKDRLTKANNRNH
jgi:hypothetical protein